MEIDRIAKIARIRLTDDEKQHLESQLNRILEWAKQIEQMELGDEEYFTDKTNVFREDKVEPFPDSQLIVKNFPKVQKGKVIVPRSL
jgi:aspartyl/glutamyl-tRNA(Asn/Gln) amidotransferase C subunit